MFNLDLSHRTGWNCPSSGQMKLSNQKNRKVAMKPNETFNNRISRCVSYAGAIQVPKQSHYNLKSRIVGQLGWSSLRSEYTRVIWEVFWDCRLLKDFLIMEILTPEMPKRNWFYQLMSYSTFSFKKTGENACSFRTFWWLLFYLLCLTAMVC